MLTAMLILESLCSGDELNAHTFPMMRLSLFYPLTIPPAILPSRLLRFSQSISGLVWRVCLWYLSAAVLSAPGGWNLHFWPHPFLECLTISALIFDPAPFMLYVWRWSCLMSLQALISARSNSSAPAVVLFGPLALFSVSV